MNFNSLNNEFQVIFNEIGFKNLSFCMTEDHEQGGEKLKLTFSLRIDPLFNYQDYINQIFNKDNILKRHYDLEEKYHFLLEEIDRLKEEREKQLKLSRSW